jgi:hypothetical protein
MSAANVHVDEAKWNWKRFLAFAPEVRRESALARAPVAA